MKKMKYSEGFSSLEILLTLFFITLIVTAASILLSTIKISVLKKNKDIEEKNLIESKINEVISEIKKDSTPDIDSKIDSIWKMDGIERDGCKIELTALSGLLDLNFTPKEVFIQPEINRLFSTADAPLLVNEYKAEGNLYTSYEQLKDLIDEENFNKYFSIYGYANFNIGDEFGIRNLLNNLTSSNTGDYFVQKRKTLLVNKQFIQNENNYKMFCGIEYENIIPYVNIKPVLNIHFVDENILKALISYPGFKISGINQKVNTILNLRESSEISQTDICNILGISKTDELYYYLGNINWMWKIKIKGKSKNCTVILCRKPEEEITLKTPEFYMLEKKWYE